MCYLKINVWNQNSESDPGSIELYFDEDIWVWWRHMIWKQFSRLIPTNEEILFITTHFYCIDLQLKIMNDY